MKFLPLVLLFVSCNLFTESAADEERDAGITEMGIVDVASIRTCECDALNLTESCESRGYGGGFLKCDTDCNFDESGCSAVPGCGDEKLGTNEQCEGFDLRGRTCQTEDFDPGGGISCDTRKCRLDTSSCVKCDDGELQTEELCDGDLFNTTCDEQGFDGGQLSCKECELNTENCFLCGDGRRHDEEECDSADLNGQTCQDFGFVTGTLGCSDECGFDTSGCSHCGDGVLDENEVCDGANLNGQTCSTLPRIAGTPAKYGTLTCASDCRTRIQDNCYTVKKVSAGARHTCIITSNNEILCWGDDTSRQSSPPSGSSFVDISSGVAHSCAIDKSGRIACWGDNSSGQTTLPSGVNGSMQKVSAGGSHTCAILKDDTLDCWGDNTHGQSDPPLGFYSQVAASRDHTCAVNLSGGVSCWGSPKDGKLLAPIGGVQEIDSTSFHTCGIQDGNVLCWGFNKDKQTDEPSAEHLAVTAGARHSCAISNKTKIITCWGNAENNKLIAPFGAFAQISAGDEHNCAVTDLGEIRCWGDNTFGQLNQP